MIELIREKNKKKVAEASAKIVLQEIKKKPNLILGLATGRTMAPFYKELVKRAKKEKISFANVKTFNLDEYAGIREKDKESLRYFMNKNFFSKVDLKKENINFLDGKARNFKKECLRYENKIKKSGGIDLQVLGIGRNGHIAFNEPGSSIKSKTRKVRLSEETRKVDFGSLKDAPEFALTTGISTILNSRKILLLTFGKEKKKAVQNSLHGKISSKVPASFLRRHKKVIFVVDEACYD